MVKPITGSTASEAARKLGHEPILVLKIEWEDGPLYYSDKDLVIGTITCAGKLVSVGSIDSNKKQDNVGMASVLSVGMDDLDGALKILIDGEPIEYKDASLYQWFQGLAQSDLMLIYRGVVVGPIEWSEGERTLKFDIETKLKDMEVGFSIDDLSPNPAALQYVDPNALNRAWPLVFGSPVHVPALRIKTAPTGHLKYPFNGPNNGPITLDPYKDDTHFTLQDGDGVNFPQGQDIQVQIDGIIFRGWFGTNGVVDAPPSDVFTVADANYPKYFNIPFGPRDLTDPENIYPTVAWLATPVSIANYYILINTVFGTQVFLRVVRQEGKKVWFHTKASLPPKAFNHPVNVSLQGDGSYKDGDGNVYPASKITTFAGSNASDPSQGAQSYYLQMGPSNFAMFAAGDTISEVAKNGRKGWTITATRPHTSTFLADIPGSTQAVSVLSSIRWTIQAGAEVSLWQPFHKDVFVANLIPSTSVVAVYGRKFTTPASPQAGMQPIPKDYYTVVLDDEITVNNLIGPVTVHPTTITFDVPLRDYNEQGWASDEIYVTLVSSQGPNTADIIKYLFDTYGSLPTDASTFAAVHTALVKYPSHFALFEKANLVSLADEIAWQARCALVTDLGEIFIKYLSVEPSSDGTFDESNVLFKTLAFSYTPTEDIITSFQAEFKTTYFPEKRFQKRLVYNSNIAKYGLRKKVFNFFIYDIQSLVQKSLTFWGFRYANSWRLARFTSKMEAVKYELFDCITMALADTSLYATSSIKTIVDKHHFDPNTDEVSIEQWLPSIAGSTTVTPGAWLSDAGDVVPADPTTAYLVDPKDYQLADDESKHNALFNGGTSSMIPAVIETVVKSPGGTYVDQNKSTNVDIPDAAPVTTAQLVAAAIAKDAAIALNLSDPTPAHAADASAKSYAYTALFVGYNTQPLVTTAKTVSVVITEYANGYNSQATKGGVQATVLGGVPVTEGDKVASFSLKDKTYVVGAATAVFPAIVKAVDGSSGTCTIDEYPAGFDHDPSDVGIQAIIVDPTNLPTVDQKVTAYTSNNVVFVVTSGGGSGGDFPAKIHTVVDAGAGIYLVDLYADGFSMPITDSALTAYVIDTSSFSLGVGDQVSVFLSNSKYYISDNRLFQYNTSPLWSWGKISVGYSGGIYKFKRTDVPGGTETGSDITCIEPNGSIAVAVGTAVPLWFEVSNATYYFWFPLGDCTP